MTADDWGWTDPLGKKSDGPIPLHPDDEVTRLRRLRLTPASSIAPRPVRWLWDGRIALGTLSLLAGREGQGKSTVAYWLVAQITRGTLPGDRYRQPKAVIVAATEDGWAEVVVPRLIAAGADLDRVYRVDVETASGFEAELSLPNDVEALRFHSREVGAAMLLLDPLMSRLSGSLDTHKDSEVRQALEPLVAVLEDTGMSALGLIHLNKSSTSDPLNAVMGSRAFGAVARSVSTVVIDAEDEGRRYLGTPKNNLGPTDLPLLSYRIEGHSIPTADGPAHTSRVLWGDTVNGTIREVMEQANRGGHDRTAAQECADWLLSYLTHYGGQAESAEVKKAARADGHSDDSLRRARERLRVQSSSVPNVFPRRTVWQLPEGPE